MSWPTTLTTLATLVANRRCYRENVYRSNRSPPASPDQELWWNTRHTSLCTLHSPLIPLATPLSRSHTLWKISLSPLPLPMDPAPSGFYFGTWSVVKTLENKFPIKQVSAVAAESSQADRTGQATPNGSCNSERRTHFIDVADACLVRPKGVERVSGELGYIAGTRQWDWNAPHSSSYLNIKPAWHFFKLNNIQA